MNELVKFNPELKDKPRVLAISKSDVLDEELQKEMAEELPKDIEHVFISSVTGKNIQQLKDILFKSITKYTL